MRSTPSTSEKTPVNLRFEDNSLLPMLFGQHDENLASIEHQLGVSMITRGNRLAISGPADAVAAARSALGVLYQRLKTGLPVDSSEVNAAVRLAASAADNGDGLKPGELVPDDVTIATRKRLISPRSTTQATYIRALRGHDLVLGLGPAGTGKTYLAVAVAVSMLVSGRVDRIVLSRPAVEAGERLGFLPGDIKDKVDPYLRPLYDALYDMLPGDQVMRCLSNGEIEIAPLAFMRGRTLSNAFVILDEAQNTTQVQMKMLLTRLGENSRMAVTGDMSQIDLPDGVVSGLDDAIEILDGIEDVVMVHFTDADVVRHPLVTRIVQAYDARDKRTGGRGRNRK